MKRLFFSFLALSAIVALNAQPKLSVDNVKEIVKAMTLDEKVSFVVGTQRWGVYPPDPAPDMPVRPQREEGVSTAFSEGKVKGAAGDVCPLPRFGVPSMVLADGPAGLRIDPTRPNDPMTYYCTAFPTASLLAASWNVDLVEQMTSAIGEEARDYGVDILLAPGVNIMRNPLCGRNYEYFSEDPLLAGKMAAAYIRGVQKTGVGCSLKHFAVNNQETYRNGIDAVVDEHALRDIYLRPFEIAVKDGKPWTVMSSYNKINGTLASENKWLLKDVLRGEWGFDGFVMTDWWAEENGARQIAAGNDMLMPGTERQKQEIINGIRKGELSESELDWCVENILRIVLRSHSFNGYDYNNKPELASHASIARNAASDGMVLLENDGTLPFDKGKVALVGVNSYYTLVGGSGSGNVNRKYDVSIFEGLAAAGLDIDEMVAKKYNDYIDVKRAKHDNNTAFWIVQTIDEFALTKDDAAKMAGRNDVCIMTIGRMAGEGADRTLCKGDYYLSDVEMGNLKTLCDVFHKHNKKVIVLLSMGNMVDMATWKDLPDAILHTWLAGQEVGNAVADVLTGKVSPSGRLPFTIAMRYEDYPSAANFPLSDNNPSVVKYVEGKNVGYRHFEREGIKPLYPFGYGLSYTTFQCSDVIIDKTDNSHTVHCTVRNTGKRTGKEVVQVYATNMDNADAPRQLMAFAKTRELAPGECQTMEMCIELEEGRYVVEVNGEKLTVVVPPLYLDDKQPLESRVEDALRRMTLDEKVALTHAQSKFSSAGVPSLGIPELWMSDGPHGVRAEINWNNWNHAEWTNDSCTAFPALTCLAATWNPELSFLYGRMVGEEARYRDKDILLGPGVNIYRTPLGGRNFEYMGEDPLLASRMVVPYIKGLQENGVAACVKHFALNNQERWRDHINVEVSDRALHEIYLPAFKAAAIEGGAWSFMSSYNKFRGEYVSNNRKLLREILKDDWNWDGVVVTDWGACHDTYSSAMAGLDIEMGTGTNGLTSEAEFTYDDYYFGKMYKDMLEKGKIPMSVVDEQASRILRLIFRTAMNRNKPFGRFICKEHYDACRDIADEGIVLLKNENSILPINPKMWDRILVVGENATKRLTEGGGSSELKVKREISPLEGLTALYGSKIDYAKGYESGGFAYDHVDVIPQTVQDSLFNEAIEKAADADLIVFVGGLNKNFEQDCESSDRTEYGLPFGQERLITELTKMNKPIVLVLISGNAVELPFVNKIPAIVQAWYLGSEAGEAIADILSGKVNPSGKLPFSFPVSLADNGAHHFGTLSYPGDSLLQEYKEDILVGYRWHDTMKRPALFSFGHGLSYTSFEYGRPIINGNTVELTVTNNGKRAGKEVVQLYVGDDKCSVSRPTKELKHFQKVSLQPGETATVSFTLTDVDFQFYDNGWKVEPGTFTLYIGSSSTDIRHCLKKMGPTE